MKKKLFTIIGTMLIAVLGIVGLVGCNEATFDADKNITVIVRKDGSGTKGAFMEILGLEGGDVSGAITIDSTTGVLTEVKGNPQAVAYESLGYVTDEVKTLTIDGVAATVANIKNGSYAIARPLNIVYLDATLSDTLNQAFYTFLGSATAQGIISENGYVSTKDSAPTYTAVTGLSGTINISGSTSLEPLMVILAAKFKEIQSGVTINVTGGGSGTGFTNASNGTSDFGMMSRDLKASEQEAVNHYEVAKDGIAVIVNKSNTYTNITTEQLKNIYGSDSEIPITKWSQLG